jgi:hypothetical protein
MMYGVATLCPWCSAPFNDRRALTAHEAVCANRLRPIEPPKAISILPKQQGNDVFLFKRCSTNTVMIGIGSRMSKRSVTLSDEEAQQLAYWLMSLAAGGGTHGYDSLRQRLEKKAAAKAVPHTCVAGRVGDDIYECDVCGKDMST